MVKKSNFLRALWEWLLDKFIEHWPTVAATIFAGGGMTYLASITDWLHEYGPVAWGGIGLFAMLITSCTYWLFGSGRKNMAIAEFSKSKAETSGVQVLAPGHTNEKINLVDFYNPFFKSTSNVRFENCHLIGPAFVLDSGGTYDEVAFIECEVVIIRQDRPIVGAMKFERCAFLRCHLYRVTLAMSLDKYEKWPEDLRKGLKVISDGRIGDV